MDGGFYFQAVAYNTGIGKQPAYIGLGIFGNTLKVESIERLSVILPFLKDRQPTEAGLRSFQGQILE